MPDPTHKPAARLLRIGIRAVVSIAFIAIALVFFNALKNARPSPEQLETQAVSRSVRTITASPSEVPRWWIGYASVDPINAADIAAEVTAVVIERPAWLRAGAKVERGQVILTLDPSDYDSRLAQANAVIGAIEANLDALEIETESLDEQINLAHEAVDLLQWELDQLIDARRVGASSDAEIERQRRQLSNSKRVEEALQERRRSIPSRRAKLQADRTGAHADKSLAETNVRRCTVPAPFAGVIQSVTADSGERVTAGQTLFRIVDPDHLEIPVRLPASAANEITIGAPAQITPTSGEQHTIETRVARLAPEADPNTRTITVYVEVDQVTLAERSHALLPGQFVRARVRSSEVRLASLVPRSAIDNDRLFVIGADNRAEPRDVGVAFYVNSAHPELDPHETQWAAIVTGVEAGETVITSNLDEIVAGTLVKPIGTTDPAGAGGGG